MNVLDHVSLGVPSIEEARKFYDPVFETLGLSCLAANDIFAAYGIGAVQFLLMIPANGEAYSRGNGTHVAMVAGSQVAVRNFHSTSLNFGGTSAGEPGPRPDYPASDVYAAFVIDPFGHKLEAIHNGFAA